jgi:hypothetical protein
VISGVVGKWWDKTPTAAPTLLARADEVIE